MDSNHRPSGYEPDELPLLHAASCREGTRFRSGSPPASVQVDGARTYSPSGHPASTFGATAFHDPVRDGSGWVHCAPRTPLVQGRPYRCNVPASPSPHGFLQGSPRPCAPVTSTPHDASSAGRLPSYLLGGLPAKCCEYIHLGGHFPLRCFQRFLLPDIATEPAGCPTTPPPAVRPRRSSRTERSAPQCTKRP